MNINDLDEQKTMIRNALYKAVADITKIDKDDYLFHSIIIVLQRLMGAVMKNKEINTQLNEYQHALDIIDKDGRVNDDMIAKTLEKFIENVNAL